MKTVTFRLRKRKDKDLIEAVKGIDQGELSDIIRQALRKELKAGQESQPKQEQKKGNPHHRKGAEMGFSSKGIAFPYLFFRWKNICRGRQKYSYLPMGS